MKIQKNIRLIIVHSAVLVTCCAAPHLAFSKELASVNGRLITDHDLSMTVSGFNEGQKESLMKDSHSKFSILQGLVDMEVLTQEAEKLKLEQAPEVKHAVTLFRRQLIVNQLLDKKLTALLTPSALQKYFNTHKDIYSTSLVHVQQILVSDESEAKRLKKLAEEKSEQFQELAELHSKDPRAKTNHGDLGFVGHDRLVKEFTDTAFATPDGKIAGPIKTIYGYHVIKVIEKRMGKALEFAEVELRVRDDLRAELIRDFTDKLRVQATIRIDEASVGKL